MANAVLNVGNELKEQFSNIPERISGLGDLAYNLWWSWHPAARMVFKLLDRQAWKGSGHNPVKMLRELPKPIFETAANNPEYLHHYDVVLARFRRAMATRTGWFQDIVPDSDSVTIAYYSAEYGLHHSLPFYAGGLGFLAGDHLKECSELRVPIVAVGFMYPEGYLRQKIPTSGWQENVDQQLDRTAAPIMRVKDDHGKQLIIQVPFIDPLFVAVWKVSIGRVPLYLLDTDIEQNDPWNRKISAHLYIGDIEQRLRQEIVLGIGGSEVLSKLGIRHSMLHLNEGHSAFALLERIRERVTRSMAFEQAAEEVRATSVFTTHTPVSAGIDVFPFPLIEKYFRKYYPLIGLDRDSFLSLGANPIAPAAGFNMTILALRLSGYHNAVSKRNGEVVREMWRALWPGVPTDNIPIDFVTNGIHVPTWIEPKLELLFNKYLGPNWLSEREDPATWELVEDIPDEELWQVHYWLKLKLVNFLHERVRQRWVNDRMNPSNVVACGTLLDPSALTIGFARRFATYKRADLIFTDLGRLKKMLNDPWMPVQIIFAGKAHPADDMGKRIIQKIFIHAQDPELGGRIAFVEDYDERIAQYMVHGVDVWLNNPLPPMEASGTSGMKASLNGVPQLSILDGWWIEGYTGTNGWAFEPGDGDKRDLHDAERLYTILERQVIPLFYRVDEKGIPRGWVRVMKNAIKTVTPRFCARRMVKEYVQKYYHRCLKPAMA